MSLGELYQQDVDRSLSTMAAIPPDPPKRDERTAWGAPWRAIKAAAADVLGSTADVLKGYGAASAMTLEADPVARAVLGDKAVQQGAAEGRRQIATGEALVSDVGQSFRQVSKDQRPDPVTASKAEQIVFGVVRPVSKLVAGGVMAGPFGIVGAAGEEGFTQSEDLREQGVDFATRTKIGTLTAGVNAAGAFLPMAGPTLKATAGLYLLGGPGAFMAQQQATRKILEHADYAELAKQYDPLDPTGLALSALIPLPFAAHGAVRNVRAARGSNATARPEAAPPAVAPEVVDAAMTHNLTVQQDVHEAVPPAARAAEVMRGPVTENPNFKAWFGDSKVVGEDGAPMVVYHGTTHSFDTFDPNAPRTALPLPGFFFSPHPEIASTYAAIGREIRDADGFIVGAEGGNTVPVYLSIKNPILLRYDDRKTGRMTSYKTVEADLLAARKAGHDGAIIEGWADGSGPMQYVAFRPEQIKSAIGNSGRFDPNSASLTDPVQARIDATPTEAATALETRDVTAAAVERMRTLSDEQITDTPAPLNKPSTDPLLASIADRVSAVEATAGDMVVRTDEAGRPVTVADELARIRREAAEGTDAELGALDADLVRVAAECALSMGST